METNQRATMNDSETIKRLGGPAVLAKRLGYKNGGTQRVFNWTKRGIPAQVKVDFPKLFLGKKAV
jgi:hypothetical protein